MNKLKSRKFWVTVSTEIVGLVMLFSGAQAAEAVQMVAGAIITVLTALGYLYAESKVDASRGK